MLGKHHLLGQLDGCVALVLTGLVGHGSLMVRAARFCSIDCGTVGNRFSLRLGDLICGCSGAIAESVWLK